MDRGHPRIDGRDADQLGRVMLEAGAAVLPGWALDAADVADVGGVAEGDAGRALVRVAAYLADQVVTRLDRTPRRDLAAFLQALDLRRPAARSARAPVTFSLAADAREVVAPAGTRLTAKAPSPDDPADVVFETVRDLQLTPARLRTVLAADPRYDQIVSAAERVASGAADLRTGPFPVLATASQGDRAVQLDRATELKAGDTLLLARAAEESKAQYGRVAADPTGSVVMLERPLDARLSAGAELELVQSFRAWGAGYDVQEHALLIGHPELLAVSGAAVITVRIDLRATPGAAPVPLTWEWWGVTGLGGVDGQPGWQPFAPNAVTDGTAGLTKSGTVDLEIPPPAAGASGLSTVDHELGGVPGRWIRARVSAPLPPGREGTILDQVRLAVTVNPGQRVPDKAFHNTTPLDVSAAGGPIRPFGPLPRIYDQFVFSSDEVLSKAGAKVKIQIEAEVEGALGPPVAVRLNGVDRVFAIGSGGRLVERQVVDGVTRWKDWGTPPDMVLDPEVELAVAGVEGQAWIFAVGRGSTVTVWWHRSGTTSGPSWTALPLDPTMNGRVSGIAAIAWNMRGTVLTIMKPLAQVSLYLIDGTGAAWHKLLLRTWFHNGSGDWLRLPAVPGGVQLAGAPRALEAVWPGRPALVCLGKDAGVFLLTSFAEWMPLEAEGPDPQRMRSHDGAAPVQVLLERPYARRLVGTETTVVDGPRSVEVFVVDRNSKTPWRFDGVRWQALPTEKAFGGASLASGVTGWIQAAEGGADAINIAGTLDNGQLALWNEADGWRGASSTSPPSKIRRAPAVSVGDAADSPASTVNLYGASVRNSFVGLELAVDGERSTWSEVLDPAGVDIEPKLSWEYWNGASWLALRVTDETSELRHPGPVTIDSLPGDIAKATVNGQEGRWIRARLVGGDYGQDVFVLSDKTADAQVVKVRQSVTPPLIRDIRLSYQLEEAVPALHCLTRNNLTIIDESVANRLAATNFRPFRPLEGTTPAVYLGFDKPLTAGPLSIFVDVRELVVERSKRPALRWECWREGGWSPVTVVDGTVGLTRPGVVRLNIVDPTASATMFGTSSLHWVRGIVTDPDDYPEPVDLRAVLANTDWALQVETIRDEIVSSQGGEAHLVVHLTNPVADLDTPALAELELGVREVLTGQEQEALIAASGSTVVLDRPDLPGTWVRWTERTTLADSNGRDRHFTLDRANGEVRFGDGRQGMIPPAGHDRIRAFRYLTGGGVRGNVGPDSITTLVTAVAGVDSVTNHLAGGGGSDAATLDETLATGPRRLRHRERAVALDDYCDLACEASRSVARAQARSGVDADGRPVPGTVQVVIVPVAPAGPRPAGQDGDQPQPSPSLMTAVRQYLERRAPVAVVARKGLSVTGPRYRPVAVQVEVTATSLDTVAQLAGTIKTRLDRYLHPLHGGVECTGWPFGAGPYRSQLVTLIEGVPGVDRVDALSFLTPQSVDDELALEPDELVAAATGSHQVVVNVDQKE